MKQVRIFAGLSTMAGYDRSSGNFKLIPMFAMEENAAGRVIFDKLPRVGEA